MLTLVLITILVLLIYYFVVVRNGNLKFWKIISKNPDLFFSLIESDPAWFIDNGDSVRNISLNDYDGPYFLFIPSLQKTIKFYGKIGSYETSQKNILDKFLLNKLQK